MLATHAQAASRPVMPMPDPVVLDDQALILNVRGKGLRDIVVVVAHVK